MSNSRVYKVELVIDDVVEWSDFVTEDRIPVQVPHLRAKGNRSCRPWQIFVYRQSSMYSTKEGKMDKIAREVGKVKDIAAQYGVHVKTVSNARAMARKDQSLTPPLPFATPPVIDGEI
jgi:hypothetical protein